MSDDYFVIHKKVLPDCFEKVLLIKELINSGKSISDACKEVDLSRSTFYKYKDYVNRPSNKIGKRIILSFKLYDKPKTLSNVLNNIASLNANVLTINQEIPINNIAYVTISISIFDVEIQISNILNSLKEIENVIDVTLIAVE